MSVRLTEVSAGDRSGWLAVAEAGHPVGTAFIRPTAEGRAELELEVHPAERRTGIGTLLLEAAAGSAQAADRAELVCGPVEEGSVGEQFLVARGLRPVLRLTYTRLDLADPPLPDSEPRPGYRLVAWTGTVPDELATSFARSRRAMDDMPMDELGAAPEPWDVDRLHAVAAAVADRGDHLDTVAAVAESDGTIVGFTEVVVPADGRGEGLHYGTGVLPEHRGRGLAVWMKAEAVRRVRAAFPGLAGLVADTADGNVAMRRVNERLGYRPTHRSVVYLLDLEVRP
jgi:GNAT superfamily N-acetyltransferase